MCLGVPGEVIEIETTEGPGLLRGILSFGGVRKSVCLAYVPDVRVGDYVVVHAGFALSVIDTEQARAALAELDRSDEIP